MGADGDGRGRARLRRLFDLLISGDTGITADLRRCVAGDAAALLALAVRHKVSWAAAERLLDGCGPHLDGPDLEAVRECARSSAAWRETHRAQLVELFQAVDVPLLHVKGFAVEAWNGGGFVRDTGDVDVTAADLETAVAALASLVRLGYRLQETCWLRATPGGDLCGPLIAVSERPGEPDRCVELSAGGFPTSAFSALPLSAGDGVDLRLGCGTARVASRMQSLLVLCAETMQRPLVLRDAVDLVLLVESGGTETTVPALLEAVRAADLAWPLQRLAAFAVSLLPDRPDHAARRAWLRAVVAGARRPLAGGRSLGIVGRSVVRAWGRRRGALLVARYAHHCAESWLFDRDLALGHIQRLNRRRDPLAALTGSGGPVFTVPVHTGPTAGLRGAPGVRVAAEGRAWWAAEYAGARLLVLPVGVYLLTVDCVLEPAGIARLERDLDRLASR